ncbi:SdrD B-like domain-containing protein [Phenylobacterium sp. VNQ135]|uniref:SdrD B-like domain-containing protein n=1 Tax=Phenylobacterium sp. VNQ135 TaxID=3400922 RepID=UPI003C0DEF57
MFATPDTTDLSVLKDVSLDAAGWVTSGLVVDETDDHFFIRLRAANAVGGEIADTVIVTDDVPNALNLAAGSGIPAALTTFATDSVTKGTLSYNSNGQISWTIPNMAPGDSETAVIRVNRPMGSGAYTNTATVTSPDTTESNTANNNASASYTVDPLADITVNSKTVTPNPARVGVLGNYTISVRNNGPNPAAGVQLSDTIDPTRFELVGNPTTTKPSASCSKNDGTGEVTCTLGAFNRGDVFQVVQQIRPRYPFGGATSGFPIGHTNTASVTTTTTQVAGHQTDSNNVTHDVNAPQYDLQITKAEPGPAFDPIEFGGQLVYNIRVSNVSPSRATNVVVTDLPSPPAGGYTMVFDSFTVNPVAANGGFTLYTPPAPNCAVVGSNVECRLHGSDASLNYLDPGRQVIFQLKFNTGGSAPSTTLTFTNNANVTAAEQPTTGTPQADANLANNVATQTTTVLPRTDLEVVSKTLVTAEPANVNQPLQYDVVIRNNGPSDTTQVRLTDTLPSGFQVMTPAPVVTGVTGGLTVGTISCTGTTTVVCVLDGAFPGDGSTATVRFTVRAVYPFTQSIATPHQNTAAIAPGQDGTGNPISRDTVSSNNSKTETVQLQESSLAGVVYNDIDRDNVMDAGEALSGVTVQLNGVDDYGNTLPVRTATTNASGAYSFDKLPGGTYSAVETQPADYFDWTETAGTSAGTVNNAAFTSAAANNTISAIALAPNTAATGYIFREVREASLSGYIYRDLDKDGTRDGGEAGYAPAAFASAPHVRLTGNDYSGAAVNLTALVDNNGQYSFADLPPSDAAGYTVTELVQPTAAADGLETNGVGAVVANSDNRPAPENLVVGDVAPGQALTERNFGELPSATLSGFVFFDINQNAVRDPADTAGVAGATLTLTGVDDLGAAVNCTVSSSGSGAYSFPNASDPSPACQLLRAGTYTVTVTPPAGLDHVGAYVGSLGGQSGAASGANTPSVGAANLAISNIVLNPGSTAVNYNFAESGEALTGYVYVDRNNNGVRDGGEIGIAGVNVTLSGTTANGDNVCTLLVSCVRTTDATGAFTFLNLPTANGAGYTLTEQSQASAPLSQYGDGLDAAGTVGGVTIGTAGNDVISSIQVGTGQLGVDYRFGERPAALAGSVYRDDNDNGVRDAGEVGIASVLVTLSGTTALGADICTQRAALPTPLSCVVTTPADGSYSFGDLPAGTYDLVETHPNAYVDGRETAGASGGAVNNAIFDATPAANRITGIALAAGAEVTGYLFGERSPPTQPVDTSLTGRVFLDPQRDGVDDNERGISGVIVRLLQNGSVVQVVTTDADGGFSFPGVGPGAYTVEELQPAGYGSSTPNSVAVVVTTGTPAFVRFGETVSTLSGAVYVDANNDNVRQADEAGIAGVELRLTGTAEGGAPVSLTATTGPDGAYRFTEVLGGNYILTETQPAGFDDRGETAGTAGGTVENDRISGIVLPVGSDATGYLFGENGTGLQGSVYLDLNDNGARDADEPGIDGVTVRLLDQAGAVIRTTTTGASGSFNFPGVAPGTYTIEEVQPAGYGDGRENPNPRVPVTVTATATPVTNYGEKAGSISGAVYVDQDGNGQRGPSEPAIGGVTVTLTGTDARGRAVTQTTTTAADGSYRFVGVVGGTYTVTETQPADYTDGAETVGSVGGALSPPDAIGGIVLGPAQDATGYLFGERGARAQLSGSVWLDLDHDRARDPNEPPKADWTVELRLGDALIGTAKTNANGDYQFVDLAPGSGYRLRFISPEGHRWGGARPNEDGQTPPAGQVGPENPGGARFEDGELVDIKLAPGANVTEQSLPLDPAGVVYDAVRRTPVPGAVVKFTGPAGFDPAQHLLGGAANVSQTTGADGIYQFLLLQGAPAGTYSLQVTPPAGYNPVTPSALIPPCPGALTVGATPSPMLVSTITGAPPTSAVQTCATGAGSTAYFLSFVLTVGVSADVLNNNLPIDPLSADGLVVTKTTPMVNVTRGGLVPYTITVRNATAGAMTGVTLNDRTPAGFRYRKDSARIDGVAAEPVEQGRLLSWSGLNFAPNEEKKIDLILTVGAGVGSGEHVNQAFATSGATGTVISNLADATVRLGADPDFDCTDVLGKVFDDRNANGVQDEGEPGLGGVRLATTDGLLVTTDAEGRYHITCPMVPNEARGSNFILKLDERTLPTGYRMVTGNPETVRLTRGKFAKLNFGASLHRVVRLDVASIAFEGEQVADAFRPKVGALVQTLAERPAVLRVAYHAQDEDADLVKRRVANLREAIEREWRRDRDRYRLVIELETAVGGVQ